MLERVGIPRARRMALRFLEGGVMLTQDLTMNAASLPMGEREVDTLVAAFGAALDAESEA